MNCQKKHMEFKVLEFNNEAFTNVMLNQFTKLFLRGFHLFQKKAVQTLFLLANSL